MNKTSHYTESSPPGERGYASTRVVYIMLPLIDPAPFSACETAPLCQFCHRQHFCSHILTIVYVLMCKSALLPLSHLNQLYWLSIWTWGGGGRGAYIVNLSQSTPHPPSPKGSPVPRIQINEALGERRPPWQRQIITSIHCKIWKICMNECRTLGERLTSKVLDHYQHLTIDHGMPF